MIETAAGSVRVRDSRTPGPTVVLACDPPNVVEHYDALFDLLTASHRVVCLELPGFGFSRPAAGFRFGLQDYAETVESLLDELETAPATLAFSCVWSYVALRVAARRSDLVSALVLVQAPKWSDEAAWARRIDSTGVIRTPLIGQVATAVVPKQIAHRWYSVALPPDVPVDTFSRPARTALANGALFCLASFTQAWFGGPAPDFAPVTQATVILWGGADRSHRRSIAESAVAYAPQARMVLHPEAGHFPELEQPDRLKTCLDLLRAR
jgi:pimeloyl-ACP methyl ester carboxylesterase